MNLQQLHLDRTNLESILNSKVPYNDTTHKSYYPYGTAGFREYATELHPIMVRIGFAMALLAHHIMITSYNMSQQQQQQQQQSSSSDNKDTTEAILLPSIHVGIMITASHNSYEYNGVKCIYYDGGMIPPEAETFVTKIVNTRNINDLITYIQEELPSIILKPPTNTTTTEVEAVTTTSKLWYHPPTIHIGYDTRPHSVEMSNLVMEGIQLLLLLLGTDNVATTSTTSTVTQSTVAACSIQNHMIVTTPMLHHKVKHQNGLYGYYHHLPSIIFPHVDGYYHILLHAYQSLLFTKIYIPSDNSSNQIVKKQLHVDCACGVAYEHLQAILNLLTTSCNTATTIITAHNPPSEPHLLNHLCGSEYVQKQQCSCIWYDDDSNNQDRSYCASLDGDGDRIVFFATTTTSTSTTSAADEGNKKREFLLLDGDYIACLLCTFIQDELLILHSYMNDSEKPKTEIRCGVVQTAYANGASTYYLRTNNIPVIMAKTGVKYVHAAAHENFDIGIYFESNGHGTVIFNDVYYQFLYKIEEILYPSSSHKTTTTNVRRPPPPNVCCAYQRLKILPSLINQAVGDAISDLLLIDAILYIKNWTLSDWYTSLYTNLPSRQTKVKVVDRTIIQTNDDETQCLSPIQVQPALQALMTQYTTEQARIFIRPSGTEDVVRVYAEATTQEMADTLAQQAEVIVKEYCGGI